MHYAKSEFSSLCNNLRITHIERAMKLHYITEDFHHGDNMYKIRADKAAAKFIELCNRDGMVDEFGNFNMPILKTMGGRRLKIINKINIYQRWLKSNIIYITRSPNGEQIVWDKYVDAIVYAEGQTQYTKRAVNTFGKGTQSITFTEEEMRALLRHLPRNDSTKYVVTKIANHLEKLKEKKL